MQITIDPNLKALAPKLALGAIFAEVQTAEVQNKDHEPGLWSEIENSIRAINSQLKLEELASVPEIKATRDAYRALGKDPSRYRCSQEALLRRVLQGKGLFQINTVVDINNLVSMESRDSLGSYDRDRLNGPVTFRAGQAGEKYKGIGKDMINLEGLPIFSDDSGPFGSPTSDSERAMITLDARRILMVIISFSGPSGLEAHMERASQLLRTHARGVIERTQIIQ